MVVGSHMITLYVQIMKDSIDFGKVQTYEELKMLRELEKHYKKHPVKRKRKYSRDISKIKLKGGVSNG